MHDIRCSFLTPAGRRCPSRATPEARLCTAHDPSLAAARSTRWTPRALSLDLLALNSSLETRESIQLVLDAVMRLQAARAIDQDRARSILRACELAIRNLGERRAARLAPPS